jgi:hypothetical protein
MTISVGFRGPVDLCEPNQLHAETEVNMSSATRALTVCARRDCEALKPIMQRNAQGAMNCRGWLVRRRFTVGCGQRLP